MKTLLFLLFVLYGCSPARDERWEQRLLEMVSFKYDCPADSIRVLSFRGNDWAHNPTLYSLDVCGVKRKYIWSKATDWIEVK